MCEQSNLYKRINLWSKTKTFSSSSSDHSNFPYRKRGHAERNLHFSLPAGSVFTRSVERNISKPQKIPSTIIENVISTVQLQLLRKCKYFQNIVVLPSNKGFLILTSAAASWQQICDPCQKSLIQILMYSVYMHVLVVLQKQKTIISLFQKTSPSKHRHKVLQIYFISNLFPNGVEESPRSPISSTVRSRVSLHKN